MKTYYFVLLSFVLAIVGCTSPVANKSTTIFADIIDSNDSLITNKQQISPKRASAIELPSKRILQIPKYAFLYESGDIVKETVDIEIKEYTTIADILGASLQTKADNGILETQGMYFIAANTSSGKKVKINPKYPLQLKGVLKNTEDDFNLYKGLSTDTGIVWTAAIPSAPKGPVHFAAIFFGYQHGLFTSAGDNQYYSPWRKDILEWLHKEVDLVKFQNTIVASPAFVERFIAVCDIYDNLMPDNSEFRENKGNDKRTASLFRYVAGQLKSLALEQMSLQQLDSALLEQIKTDSIATIQYYKREGDKNIKIDAEINKAVQWYRNEYCRSTCYEQFDFTQKIIVDTLNLIYLQSNDYQNLNEENQTKYTNQDIVLNARNNAMLFLELYFITRPKYKPNLMLNTFNYQLTGLGWHNIDKLLEDNLEDIELNIKVNTDKVPTSLALLLTKQKTVLYGYTSNGFYYFNEKLPSSNAIILASTKQGDNQFLFAKQEIQLGKDREVTLDLKPISQEKLTKVLGEIEQGYE